MPTIWPDPLSSGSPGSGAMARAEAVDGVTAEVMVGMPSAGPSVMAAPTPVTAPGVDSSTRSVPLGRSIKVASALPLASVLSSTNGATGTSSGTSTSAMSDVASLPTTEADSTLPRGPTRSMCSRPPSASAVVTTRPPSATAMPMRATTPWVVVARSCTIERPAASAAAGTALASPGKVVSGGFAMVSPVVVVGWSDAGESRITTKSATATRAAALTSAIMTLR